MYTTAVVLIRKPKNRFILNSFREVWLYYPPSTGSTSLGQPYNLRITLSQRACGEGCENWLFLVHPDRLRHAVGYYMAEKKVPTRSAAYNRATRTSTTRRN